MTDEERQRFARRLRERDAEIEKLRAALTAILDDPEIGVNVTLIARAALEPKP